MLRSVLGRSVLGIWLGVDGRRLETLETPHMPGRRLLSTSAKCPPSSCPAIYCAEHAMQWEGVEWEYSNPAIHCIEHIPWEGAKWEYSKPRF